MKPHEDTVPPARVQDHASLFAQRTHGLERFEAGDFATARSVLSRVVRRGPYDADLIALLSDLMVDRGDNGQLRSYYTDLIDRFGSRATPNELLTWERARFDATRDLFNTLTPEEQLDSALQLLTAAAVAGEWTPILTRRDTLEGIFDSPARRLDLLEQFAYAPAETGLPASAAAEIQAIGHRFAHDPEISRFAERLLHGAGHRDAAYGVERARRTATSPTAQESAPPGGLDPFGGVIVLIAGGHPPLRRMVTSDLTRSGALAVREIPSKWEAVRTGRSVRDRMAGSDIAVLIGRQLAHSTADQVRSAAAKLGVPVVRAETAGVQSVRRAALGVQSRS